MDEKRKSLSRYRLDKAKKCLESAKVLVKSEDYCGADETKEILKYDNIGYGISSAGGGLRWQQESLNWMCMA